MFLPSVVLAFGLLAAPSYAVSIGQESTSCHEGDTLSVWLERGDTGYGSSCEWVFDDGLTVIDRQGDMVAVACTACAGRESAHVGFHIVCERADGTSYWDFSEVELLCEPPADTGGERAGRACGCGTAAPAAGLGALLLPLFLLLRCQRAKDPRAG